MKEHFTVASNNIFSENEFFEGYFTVENGIITHVARGKLPEDLNTNIIDCKDNIVMPSLIDTHAFFSGYAIREYGIDISQCNNNEDLIKILEKYKNNSVIIARNIRDDLKVDFSYIESKLGNNISILLFNWDKEIAYVNEKAKKEFSFDGTDFSSESMCKIIEHVLNDKEWTKKEFIKYMQLLNSRGVTASKEMVFDDSYGLSEILNELDKENKLNVRIFMMSQAVAEDFDLSVSEVIGNNIDSDNLKFDGFNQMVDGSVSVEEADMLSPYENGDTCQIEIDYKKLEKDAIEADSAGYRFSLHGQGDKAVHNIINIFDKCQKDDSGKLINRHAITDLEVADPEDYIRMSNLGIHAEIYPQILSIYEDSTEKIELTNERVGNRSKDYWNRRKMKDSGVNICCATDLPLVITDIGASIYHACFGRFNDGKEFNTNNCLTIKELLESWTLSGAKNLGISEKQGKIENGYRADFVVLNMPFEEISPENSRDLKVTQTYKDGLCVFSN